MSWSNSYNDILRDVQATSSHHGILIEIPLADKAGWENDLSIAPMRSSNSQFDKLGLYQTLYPTPSN
jgi:hypothetical protein